MLETIREYATERLDDETRLRHAEWFLALAEEAEPELSGAAQADWLDRLDAEHDNLRAALAFLYQTGESALGIRLAGALYYFWYYRGYVKEGCSRLEEIRATATGDLTVEHEKLLNGAYWLTYRLGNFVRAEQLATERLALNRAIGDPKLIANSLLSLGTAVDTNGDPERAYALYAESVDLAREQEEWRTLALALHNIGVQAMDRGDGDTAQSHLEEALDLFRGRSDGHGIALTLSNLSEVARLKGRNDEATELAHEALRLAQNLADKDVIINALEALSDLAASGGQADRGARLLGASEAIREDTGIAPEPAQQANIDRINIFLRARLGEERLAVLRAEGHAMSLDEAVACARADH